MSFTSWLRNLRSILTPGRPRRPHASQSSRPRPYTKLTLEILEDRALPSTLTVINTNDSGAGSLRDAILAANMAGASTIDFNIPTTDPNYRSSNGSFTITPTSALPAITAPVTIDGYSQPGASANTNGPGLGSNTVLTIDLDGSLAPFASGLVLSGGNSTVRGLAINHFAGHGIALLGTAGSAIAGDFIGTDVSGTAVASNGTDGGDGVYVTESNVTIGGLNPADRNIIAGNKGGRNIEIRSPAANTLIEGNFIGTDRTGTVALGSLFEGIFSTGSNVLIGGTTPEARNLISGNGSTGVYSNALGLPVTVEGNYIGTDVTGTLAVPNAGPGVFLTNNSTYIGGLVGGTAPGAGNLISANQGHGVLLTGSNHAVVQGNLIGTDVTGTNPLGNTGWGINIGDAGGGGANATIGGTTAAARNIISANKKGGIAIAAAGAGHVIEGNYVGTDVTGTKALANIGTGVLVANGPSTIGGTAPGAANLISGNTSNGLDITGLRASLVAGNFIGTDVTGTLPLGNGANGIVQIAGGDSNGVTGSGNTIGGSTALARNVIAANHGIGIYITAGKADDLVQGNYIGTDVTGTKPLGNIDSGIYLNTPGNTVTGNIISANGTGNVLGGWNLGPAGIFIDGNLYGATGNLVQGNLIGTAADGSSPLGNAGIGVAFVGGASLNTLTGNTIANNSTAAVNVRGGGVIVQSGNVNAISANDIYANKGLGIDLGNNGVTANTAGGPHSGPNDLQNYPVLTSAVTCVDDSIVVGTLNSIPSTTFRVEFFASAVADSSGHGEGQTYVGFIFVTTDAAGNASFTAKLPKGLPADQLVVSATATDSAVPAGNTSEFSADVVASVLQETTTALTVAPATSFAGDAVTFTATVTPSGSGTLTGTVAFIIDGTPQTPTTLLGNLATYSTTALGVGIHTVSASYSGDGAFCDSDSNIVTETVKSNADLQVTVVSQPTPQTVLTSGGAGFWTSPSFVYSFQVTNNGPQDATNVRVEDLMTGMQLVSGGLSAPGSSGIFTGGIGYVVSYATLARFQTVTITVTGTSNLFDGPGTYADTISATADQQDSDPSNNSATVTETFVLAVADLQVAVISQPTPNPVLTSGSAGSWAGPSFVYSFQVTNNGPQDATNVRVEDLMTGMQLVSGGLSAPGSSGIFTGGIGYVVSYATLARFQTVTITVTGTSNLFDGPGTYADTISATADQQDSDPSNNSATVTETFVLAVADLQVAVISQPTPNPVLTSGSAGSWAGPSFVYSFQVTNNGPQDATDVRVEDLMTGMQLVSGGLSAPGSSGIFTGGIGYVVSYATLARFQTVTITVTGTSNLFDGPGTYADTISATADQQDSDPSNNSATVTETFVLAVADLQVAVISQPTPNPVLTSGSAGSWAGPSFVYSFQVTNNGPQDATDVRVEDLMTGMQLVSGGLSAPGSSGIFTGGIGYVVSYATLARFQTVTITVTGTSNPFDGPGTYTDTISATADQQDSDPSNNGATVTETFALPTADLQVSVANLSPNPVGVNQPFSYTVTVTNAGPQNATDVVVVDAVAGMASVFAPSQGFIIPVSPPLPISAGPWVVGTLMVGASATLQVTESSSVIGLSTDTATATADQYDPTPVDNTASSTEMVSMPDLQVSVSDPSPNPVGVNQPFSYTVTVYNAGPGPATNLDIHQITKLGGFNVFGATDQTLALLAVHASATFTFTQAISVPETFNDVFTTTADERGGMNPAPLGHPITTVAGNVTVEMPDLQVSVSAPSPNPVGVNQPFSYTVTVYNAGPGPATNLDIHQITKLGGFNVFGATDQTLALLAVHASATFTFTQAISVPETFNDVFTTTADERGGMSPAPLGHPITTVAGNVTVEMPDLQVSVSDPSPNPVGVNQPFSYTVTVYNAGPGPATNLDIHQITKLGGFNVFGATDQTLALLAVHASATFTFTQAISVPETFNDVFTTTADERGGMSPAPLGHPITTVAGNVTVEMPDLQVSVSAPSPNPVGVNQPFSYTVTVYNAGPGPATNLDIHQVTQLGGFNVFGATDQTLALLAVHASATFTFTQAISVPETFNDVFTTTADERGGMSPAPLGHPITTVAGNVTVEMPDLQVSVSAPSPNPVGVNQPFSYTVTVYNAGPGPASNLAVQDVVTGAGGIIDETVQHQASLIANSSATFTVTHSFAIAGTYSDTFSANATEHPMPVTASGNETVSAMSVVSTANLNALQNVPVSDGPIPLATFSVPIGVPVLNLSNFSAIIDWKDGTLDNSTLGSVVLVPVGFSEIIVYGNHTYASDGVKSPVVTLIYKGSDSLPATATVNVATNPNLTSPAGTTLTNVHGTANPSPGDVPAGVSFPLGFFTFTVQGVTPGGATTVTDTLPAGFTVNAFYKYSPTPSNATPHWYNFAFDPATGIGAQFSTNASGQQVITLNLIDGQSGDDDLQANGSITDPGAPALQISAPTATDLSSDHPAGSVYGQAVTYTATVSAVSGGTPTGTVQFQIDHANFGPAVTLNNGRASIAMAALPAGGHTFTAAYTSDSISFLNSATTSVIANVAPAKASTQVVSSANPAVYGQPIFFTATVTNSSGTGVTPTGTVQFVIDGSNLGTAVALDAAGRAGSLTVTFLAGASHTVKAVYSGAPNFIGSNGSMNQVVQTVGRELDALDPAFTDLFVGGTAASSHVEVQLKNGQVTVDLHDGKAPTATSLAGLHALVVYGQADNEHIEVDRQLALPAFLFGGDGANVHIEGGGGPTVEVGGGGHNTHLEGGPGRDLLIAGKGSAHLEGHGGDDILIGGYTDFDQNETALEAIMAEWTHTYSADPVIDFQTRAGHLLSGGGLYGSDLLATAATVHGNGGDNHLEGGAGIDLFFAALAKDEDKDMIDGAGRNDAVIGL